MSVRVILSTGRPIATSRSTQASAAAPAPEVTSLTSDSVLPCSTRPLRMAAAQTMAVPCWSSWKTGIFMRSRSFFSMTKHSGALMSSRLMPPKVGSSAATISTKRSMSCSSTSRSNTSIPANFLNRTALPSITGLDGQGPDIAQAQHGGAVGDHRDQIAAGGVIARQRPGRRRWPRRGRPRRGNRPAPDRAGWPCAWWLPPTICPAGGCGDRPAPPCENPHP